MSYFLLRNNSESGPFSLDQMLRMSLYPNDLVREDGKETSWTHARDVDLLKSSINYSDRIAAFDTEIRSDNVGFKREGEHELKPHSTQSKGFNFSIPLLGLLAVAIIGMVWLAVKKSNGEEPETRKTEAKQNPEIIIPMGAADSLEEDLKAALAKKTADSLWLEKRKPKNLIKLISIKANDYKVKILGGIKDLELTVENKSDVPLEEVGIQVDYLKKNDEIIHTENVFARNIEPLNATTIDVPSHSRGVKVKYKVITVKASNTSGSSREI